MALLMREAIGDSLRRTRVSQSRTLREVSSSARVSLGYLSEVERGRKEASSELLAAICDALAVPLSDVLYEVSESLAVTADRELESASVETTPEPVAAGAATVSAARTEATFVTDDTLIVIPAPALVAA
ncbi:helix-turn-helix transcriptional regulator [Aldersonia sp. NBC_00410]|jgi:transcriptional regulator with XRE-family HTH domain|uniref:helix-turn-helix domain-containing protein n=1 Tax=Aldersonia sp. NBC_00410 TaxID=2975954 RepID=UPI002257ECAC|nr:helix-turn-helix transcriptional regulator [Aldersonia sp. NBC_00410]MCX5045896.1 helix-turn-helix transcriptional regulator [Aldersonia sp. NBC_00410]